MPLNIAASVISGIGQLFGGITGAEAARKAARARSRVATERGMERLVVSAEVLVVGEQQANASREAGRLNASIARAGISGSGVDVNAGSNMVMLSRLVEVAEADAASILFQSRRESSALKREAAEMFRIAQEEIELGEAGATSSLIGGALGAGGSALAAAGEFMDWSRDRTVPRSPKTVKRTPLSLDWNA